MEEFYEDDIEAVEEIEELYSFIPDVEKSAEEDDMDFLYEDLEDEAGDIDF
ncbi:MAG: hypothetical protein J6R23_04105 [Spirochaetales bacterium]|nr:hypothetical protein [Spirochaetales bacterium]